MDKQLIEARSKDKNIEIHFHFVENDDWEDFLTLTYIAREQINPEELDYHGITDMSGYFIKDGIRVDMKYDTMIGNMLIYQDNMGVDALEKVRGWARILWSCLQAGQGREWLQKGIWRSR